MHVKCAVFDNNVILTGANLSEDYFVDRQDRYWIFNDNEKLCDYYEDLVGTLISNSHQVAPSGDCEPRVRTQLSNNSLKFSLEKQMKIFEMAYSLDEEEKAS
jgi:CDP-diacylglycerol--glycerol-3-phosphate 3-phosphatidyltransferase